MTVDDIKLTIWDYTIEKITIDEIVYLQRYFIRHYCLWMPLRAIAEQTGGRDHATIIDAIRIVNHTKLFNLVRPLTLILNAKMNGLDLPKKIENRWFHKGYKRKKHKP
jgi:hypothetical protein